MIEAVGMMMSKVMEMMVIMRVKRMIEAAEEELLLVRMELWGDGDGDDSGGGGGWRSRLQHPTWPGSPDSHFWPI